MQLKMNRHVSVTPTHVFPVTMIAVRRYSREDAMYKKKKAGKRKKPGAAHETRLRREGG